MNISSASSPNSVFGLTKQTSTSKNNLMRSIDRTDEAKAEKEKAVQKQFNQDVIADKQAIALFEKSQLEAKSTLNGNAYSPTDKDKPSPKNETAVASYQTVGNLAQRESVQQLLGVDLFA